MSDNLIRAAYADVDQLDRSLLFGRETRVLVGLGAEFVAEVTDRYGTPDVPLVASGKVETGVVMAYHSGGHDGHTSTGALGAGVPRGVLELAARINATAGSEIAEPLTRAAAFAAACAHDHTQLCGRALALEGCGPGLGDERLSAETAAARVAAAGLGDSVAHMVDAMVMATAFNPETRSQNLGFVPGVVVDFDVRQTVLGCELLAAADLLSLATRRGPLGAVEMAAESLCLRARDRVAQTRLGEFATGSALPLPEFLDAIAADDVLSAAYLEAMDGQAAFFGGWSFSDRTIRYLCGKGVDDLFPGREANTAAVTEFGDLLRAGHSPRSIWGRARALAGYPA